MSIYVTQFQEDNFLDPIFKADMILKKKLKNNNNNKKLVLPYCSITPSNIIFYRKCLFYALPHRVISRDVWFVIIGNIIFIIKGMNFYFQVNQINLNVSSHVQLVTSGPGYSLRSKIWE